MNIDQGIVKAISQKPAGKGFVYNFCLENGTWYGHGFKEPKFNKGDFIKFTWTANGAFKNVDAASVEIQEDTRPTVHTASTTATNKVDWDGKDRRITFLACRNTAVELAKLALEQGAIKLPAKGDKLDALVSQVDEIADTLYAGVYGESYPVNSTTTVAATEVDNDEE